LEDKKAQLSALQDQQMEIWNQATEDGKHPEPDMSKVSKIEGTNAAKAAEMTRRNNEMTVLGKEVQELTEVKNAYDESQRWEQFLEGPTSQMTHAVEEMYKASQDPSRNLWLPAGAQGGILKSLGQLFVEDPQYKANRYRTPISSGAGYEIAKDIQAKTLMSTTAGWAPENLRTGRLVEDA
jgi:hypothetical protein